MDELGINGAILESKLLEPTLKPMQSREYTE